MCVACVRLTRTQRTRHDDNSLFRYRAHRSFPADYAFRTFTSRPRVVLARQRCHVVLSVRPSVVVVVVVVSQELMHFNDDFEIVIRSRSIV